ncbi:sigma-24 (FecI-like) protein [Plesiocystis pacifica SIR-1]|uniref:Sigma-24 (FecI-like) protein n=1 Tax=Plesiocystis pacifica SIR-1 TaxID=391625 RepID=A6FZP5_9BACT|nr:sigma-70 family RNA polymerase sigma factor [Plesiocystis pacifica]EDM80851.1 sigma-24 (FecI-like) protein [Plesiocystis pacifica SIR-1]
MADNWGIDAELLAAWRRGDESAGRRLVERHLDAIARFFRNKLGDNTEDLIQQTFLALIEGKDRIREGTTVRAYLLSVAHNVLCGHLRERSRGRPVDMSITRMVDIAPSPSSVAVLRGEQRLLLMALRTLPIEHQVALELAYWEGFNAAEIARIVGVSHSAMRSRLVRARKLLGEAIEQVAESPALRDSTLGDLEGWAASLRDLGPGGG